MRQTALDGVVDFFLNQQHVRERLDHRQTGVGGLHPACMTQCIASVSLTCSDREASPGFLSFSPAGAQSD